MQPMVMAVLLAVIKGLWEPALWVEKRGDITDLLYLGKREKETRERASG